MRRKSGAGYIFPTVIEKHEQAIPWERFVIFARQLSHDLRNQLNAAELQAALVGELTTDPELKAEVRRLRELVSEIGTTLQNLSASVADPRPTPMPYGSKDLISDLQQKVRQAYPAESQQVKWQISSDSAMLNIDPTLIEWAGVELFDNAFRHDHAGGEVQASSVIKDDQFVFEVRGRKIKPIDTAQLERPLASATHGHYSLGLRRARAILAAHDGELRAEFDPDSSILTTRMTLPCSDESR